MGAATGVLSSNNQRIMKVNKEWFEEQCRIEGLSDKDLFVMNLFATNSDGDFLYCTSDYCGRGSLEYVSAWDLVAKVLPYFDGLWYVLSTIRKRHLDKLILMGEINGSYRYLYDSYSLSVVYREAICRNPFIQGAALVKFRKEPLQGITIPWDHSESCDVYPGIVRFKKTSKNASSCKMEKLIDMPDVVKNDRGYKFIPKILDIEDFVEASNSMRRFDGNNPYRALAELDERIMRNWTERQEILRKIEFVVEKDFVYTFFFSHFEIEQELDEKYRTCYLCYGTLEC